MKQPSIYLLTNYSRSTLYIGVTGRLKERVWQHKNGTCEGFTNKYGVHYLVYYELHQSFRTAIEREKKLKKWKRAWKERLISEFNPTWRDLYDEI
nr:GIY-YIG nuclease family protein [Vibrio scophthalmi]